MTESSIRDQAYQIFQEEALELLQLIEEGLIKLQEEYDTPHIHQLMRAAHSIKGGSASVGITGIQKIAHRLEDIFRALYQRKEPVDDDVEEALFQAYDCLRVPLQTQIETGSFDEEAAWEKAEPIFALLETVLQHELENSQYELPSAAELGLDLVHEIFTSNVQEEINRLTTILDESGESQVGESIKDVAEVLIGLGNLLELPGFTAIAQTTVQALEHTPEAAAAIGQAALDNLRAASESVLGGERERGGEPSAELIAFIDRNEDTTIDEVETQEASLDLSGLNNFFSQAALDSGLELESIDETSEDQKKPGLEEEASEEDLDLSSLNNFFSQAKLDMTLEDETGDVAESLEQFQSNSAETQALYIGEEPDVSLEMDLASVFGTGLSLPEEIESIVQEDLPEESSTAPLNSVVETVTQENIEAKTVYKEEKSKAPEPERVKIRESVRVDYDRLDRLNNLVGELITQENGANLQNQRLQIEIKKLKQHFDQFNQFSSTLQQWMDDSLQAEIKSQRLRFQDQTPATSDSKKLNKYSDWSVINEFDSLQMDSYSQFYTTIQAALDEMAQMSEQLSDINLITQNSLQIQRKKKQTLKQVRNDLLWARMIPLDTILKRFPRMVRDLSSKFDKKVRFQVIGASTLVDKVVLERLYDPLIHIVRNAFDHGCEKTDERVTKGKAAQAKIELRAYHRGNQTFIEVSDDGKGINPEKLRQGVVSKGLLPPEEAQALSTQALYQYLFEPSFSTAEQVTELSGRGMGLNAVKKQVEALKGSVSIDSELGKGTRFIIALPLTLTIAKLLVFSVDGRDMSIPVDSLQGIIAADQSDIKTVQGKFFYCDEGELIPLFPSSNFMHQYPLPQRSRDNAIAKNITQKDKTSIILIANSTEVLALEVDYVTEEQELVIKPFGKAIPAPKYLYGCAMMGDGALVPVIDPNILLSDWNIMQEAGAQQALKSTMPASVINHFQQHILVVDDSLTTRRNITLTLQKFGYLVIQAGDGHEALEQLKFNPQINAVLSDVEMPNMNGFEFLSQCRKEYTKERLPVIMLTSRSGQKHQQIAKALGANFYLTKPYLEQDLRNALESCLEAVPC